MNKPVLQVSWSETGKPHVQVEAHAVEFLLFACVDTVQAALGVEWIALRKNDHVDNC